MVAPSQERHFPPGAEPIQRDPRSLDHSRGGEFGVASTNSGSCWGQWDIGDYLSFLPDAARIWRLVALVRNYAGDELAWDVNLVLKREEVPPLSLDGRVPPGMDHVAG